MWSTSGTQNFPHVTVLRWFFHSVSQQGTGLVGARGGQVGEGGLGTRKMTEVSKWKRSYTESTLGRQPWKSRVTRTTPPKRGATERPTEGGRGRKHCRDEERHTQTFTGTYRRRTTTRRNETTNRAQTSVPCQCKGHQMSP